MIANARYYSLEENGITVAIDTLLTDELIEEGFVREIVSKVQTMRKEAGFNVEDHICIYADGNDKILQILQRNQDGVAGDTLADKIVCGQLQGYTKEWDINGETVSFGVEKV